MAENDAGEIASFSAAESWVLGSLLLAMVTREIPPTRQLTEEEE